MYYRFHVVILEMILSNLMNIWAWRYFSFSSVTLFFLCWGVLPSSLTSTHNKALMMHTFLFCTLFYGTRSVTLTYCQYLKLLCANGSYVVLQTQLKPPSIRNVVIEKHWKWIDWMETWSNFLSHFCMCNSHKHAIIRTKNYILNAACIQRILYSEISWMCNSSKWGLFTFLLC